MMNALYVSVTMVDKIRARGVEEGVDSALDDPGLDQRRS